MIESILKELYTINPARPHSAERLHKLLQQLNNTRNECINHSGIWRWQYGIANIAITMNHDLEKLNAYCNQYHRDQYPVFHELKFYIVSDKSSQPCCTIG
jgi:hypothetical protein